MTLPTSPPTVRASALVKGVAPCETNEDCRLRYLYHKERCSDGLARSCSKDASSPLWTACRRGSGSDCDLWASVFMSAWQSPKAGFPMVHWHRPRRESMAMSEHPEYRNPRFTAADIPDSRVTSVADPFLVEQNGHWFLFFEMFDLETQRGEIGLAQSEDALHWTYSGPVLKEPFHLSYPFVCKDGDDYYMVPESRAVREVRLYRAVKFPMEWALDRVLFCGRYVDTSIIAFKGKWWAFATRHPYTMEIWYSDELSGPWKPHALNPICFFDKSRARSGGRPVVLGNKVLRFVQDSRGGYGRSLRAYLVDVLDVDRFEEHPVEPDPLLSPMGSTWARNGMHHFAPVPTSTGKWFASVDGSGDGRREPEPEATPADLAP